MKAVCVGCGAAFRREDDEDWKTLCVPCFKKSKRATEPVAADTHWRDRALRAEKQVESLKEEIADWQRDYNQLLAEQCESDIDRELAEQLPRLLLVCHPDKHGNSQAATKVTQWLLDVRGRLTCA